MFDLLITGRKLVFESARSHAEVTTRLQREVAAVKWMPIENRDQQFEGTFADGALALFGVFLVATVAEARRATRMLARLFEAEPSRV